MLVAILVYSNIHLLQSYCVVETLLVNDIAQCVLNASFVEARLRSG